MDLTEFLLHAGYLANTPFFRAVQSIVTGDEPGLLALLEAHPGLIRERAPAAHEATLLHYVGANGVEVQRSPKNAPAIVRILLEAGAEVDAVAPIYDSSYSDASVGQLLIPVEDLDRAIAFYRDTLGLRFLFAAPPQMSFFRGLQSGQVIVNDVLVNYFVVESPLGGWKASGLGVRHGVEGLRQWTRAEAITVGRPLLAPLERFVARKLAFPYDPRVLAVIRRASRLLYRRGLAEKLRGLYRLQRR